MCRTDLHQCESIVIDGELMDFRSAVSLSVSLCGNVGVIVIRRCRTTTDLIVCVKE